MFSFLFENAYLGELLAPPQDSPRAEWSPRCGEIKSLIKADKTDDALALLERTPRLQQDEIDWPEEKDGLNLLHVACAANAVKIVIELLNKREANVNQQSATGNTPLHCAAINGHSNLVDLLLRYGADQSIPNYAGKIPLEVADSLQPPRGLLQNRTEIVDSILSPTALFHQRTSALQHGSVVENEKLGLEVLKAARETAAAMTYDTTFKKYRNTLFVNWIYPLDRRSENGSKEVGPEARTTLLKYPALATCRTEADSQRGYSDGYTPLHASASVGYCQMLEFLLTLPGVSAWVRDPQGKTPLHVAAEHAGRCDDRTAASQGREYARACLILRSAMRHENNGIDPVGEDAPVDLLGRTPLGCFALREARLQADLKNAVFSPGDRSTLPIPSPVPERSGCSPWRLSPVPQHQQTRPEVGAQLVYAFSEACGFKRQMEDFIVARCPLDESAYPSWSIFGICDGHGGDAASRFVSTRFPHELLNEAKARARAGAKAEGSAEHLALDEPELLNQLLTAACASTEKIMRESEPFAVEIFQRDDRGQPSKLAFQDGSGSTGVFCLATLRHLAIANVGDSRAVIARLKMPAIDTATAAAAAAATTGNGDSIGGSVSPRGDMTAPSSSCLVGTALSRDKKLSDPVEQERVVKSGATLVPPSNKDPNYRVTLEKADMVDGVGKRLIRAPGGPDEGSTASSLQLTVGAKIEAFFKRKGDFLPGTISKVHANGTVDIDYDNGEKQERASEIGFFSATGEQLPARNGNLAVARCFGDFVFKQNDRLAPEEQAVTAIPDVDVIPRGPRDAFVVLASDGVFDVMTDQEVVDFLGARLGYSALGPPRITSAADVASACDELIHHVLTERHSGDNVSCVVVILGESPESESESESADSHTPAKTPTSQPVLTPSSGTANATPVHETISRVSDPHANENSSSNEGQKAPDTVDVKRHLTFTEVGEKE